MKFAYCVTTYGRGSFLHTTLDHIPEDSEVMIIDTKEQDWALAKAWNYAADKLLWDKAFDAVVIMNDDVVLRPDTGELLAWAILDGQYENYNGPADYENRWPADHNKEILLLSARHAHWSDACTDVPDWDMLNSAVPRWEPGPDFSCFCITRRLGQVIGRFDENYYPAYFEDNDTHRRIQLAGCEAGAFAPYWHFRNGTTRRDSTAAARVHATFENCKRYYCQKWGAPYDNMHPMGRETYLTPFNK